MGGDFAPQAALEGVELACSSLKDDVQLHLYGDKDQINRFIEEHDLSSSSLVVHGTSQVIEMGESPTKAMMKKPDSSIVRGVVDLSAGDIDAFISAGNTGAVLVASMYKVKVIEGVIRPAISSLLPRLNGSYGLILDVGANPDCKPDVLYQFAILGSLYAQHVLSIDQPRIGLLNIGEEKEKGNLVTQAAYDIFDNSDKINFIGNIEGYDVFSEKTDVVVCDGFVGNVLLKASEAIFRIVKSGSQQSVLGERFDYQYYGGTPILGIRKPVLIGHGVSSPLAFKTMIQQSVGIVESKLIDKVKTTFEP